MKKFYKPINQSGECRGLTYRCESPLYDACTLFLLPDGRGLAVLQQRFNENLKCTWWGPIDMDLNRDISNHHGLEDYLENYAEYPKEGIYPFKTVRKVMWALTMPPLKKEFWETRF